MAAAAQNVDRGKTEALQRRVTSRMQALQREADQLAAQARTLLGELRALEVDRDLKAEQLKEIEADLAAATAALEQSNGRIAALETQRVAERPALQSTLVEIYKRGRGGYLRLLLGADDVRELGRAARAVSALALLDRQRVERHRRTLAALRGERDELERRNQQMTALRLEARRTQMALRASITARGARLREIDSRRDLTAQLAGELQTAQQHLQQTLSGLSPGRGGDTALLPLTPFRGDLEWPVTGRLVRRFGRAAGTVPATALAGSGIEIAVAERTPVRAVHPGIVGYAEPFTGFGNLVVLDHGDDTYTVYGYLSSVGVRRGDRLEEGDELGQSGTAPGSGTAALYFEVRVDGRSVDPVQWLKPR